MFQLFKLISVISLHIHLNNTALVKANNNAKTRMQKCIMVSIV